MARKFSPLSIELLAEAANNPQKKVELFYQKFKNKYSKKLIYNTFYRMVQLGLLEPMLIKEEPAVSITREGEKVLQTYRPTRDGVWKIIWIKHRGLLCLLHLILQPSLFQHLQLQSQQVSHQHSHGHQRMRQVVQQQVDGQEHLLHLEHKVLLQLLIQHTHLHVLEQEALLRSLRQ
jgi:hypothetical protein